MFFQTDSCKSVPISTSSSAKYIYQNDAMHIKDENCHPNQQIHISEINRKTTISSFRQVTKLSKMMSTETEELDILIRRVGTEDHLDIVKLFQVVWIYITITS